MTSASKIKGSSYERQVAKYLTDLYGCTFIRNISGSGAYVGGKNSVRKAQLTEAQIRHSKGDIVPPENFSLLNCEAKFYSDLAFHQLFETNIQLERWINQLMTASDDNDVNILFFKINRRGEFVAVQASIPWASECTHIQYNSTDHGRWMIYSLQNFFKYNKDKLKLYSGKTQEIDQVN